MIRPAAELIVALERECLTVDRAIAARAWGACERSWAAQRLLTHELDISLRETPPPADGSGSIWARIDRLTRYRERQLERLRAFNADCAKRLAMLGRFKSFARTRATPRRASLLDVNT